MKDHPHLVLLTGVFDMNRYAKSATGGTQCRISVTAMKCQ